MGTRESNKTSQVVVNPEWEKLGPEADVHFITNPNAFDRLDSPPTPLPAGPAPVPAGAGNVFRPCLVPIIYKRRVCPSTEVKALRRQLRLAREEIARLTARE
jgi:hypothetical protein